MKARASVTLLGIVIGVLGMALAGHPALATEMLGSPAQSCCWTAPFRCSN